MRFCRCFGLGLWFVLSCAGCFDWGPTPPPPSYPPGLAHANREHCHLLCVPPLNVGPPLAIDGLFCLPPELNGNLPGGKATLTVRDMEIDCSARIASAVDVGLDSRDKACGWWLCRNDPNIIPLSSRDITCNNPPPSGVEILCRVPPSFTVTQGEWLIGTSTDPVSVSSSFWDHVEKDHPARIVAAPMESSATVTFSPTGGGRPVSTAVTIKQGDGELPGIPCAGAGCVGIGRLSLAMGDFSVRDHAFTNGQVDLSFQVLTDSVGTLTIPPGSVSPATIEVLMNGISTGTSLEPDAPLRGRVDYVNKHWVLVGTFSGSVGANGADGTITVEVVLAGPIANQPPQARTGPDQVVECTHPGGADVVLDASASTDPDGDKLLYAWTPLSGPATGTVLGPAFDTTLSTSLALGKHTIELMVTDRAMIADRAVTKVDVVDTVPPVITSVTSAPICMGQVCGGNVQGLYLPFKLGRDLFVGVRDACDSHPRAEVVGVTCTEETGQPCSTGSQGQPEEGPPFAFGPTGVCLHVGQAVRTYVVSLQAVNAQGLRGSVATVSIASNDNTCPAVPFSSVVPAGAAQCKF